MLEIRIHGRGGQGSVTAAQLLAIAAFHDGKMSQAFPKFGVERRGAPVEAFCRLDDSMINVRSQVYEPDIIMVLEPSLIDAVDVTKGLKKGAKIVINTNQPITNKKLAGFDIHTVDASKVAMEIFHANIVNTAILGAFAKVSGLISINGINKAIDERFKGKDKLIELNKKAVKHVFESVQ